MKYEVKFTSHFKKDYKLPQKRGRDVAALDKVIEMLAEGQTLPDEYHDHSLVGTTVDAANATLSRTGFSSTSCLRTC